MGKAYFIGCDVGTGSARAGVFDRFGKTLSIQTHPIKMWRPKPDFVEQSSDDIWKACCYSVKKAVKEAEVGPDQIKGIGFDATCSLVVLGENDKPVSVSPDGSDEQNVIVWMDHRAIQQTEGINRTAHEVLRYVGGNISPEMQTPKLLWLKQYKPGTWRTATKFLDLPDFLVYKATGEGVRSVCTTTCKWTYLAHEDSNSDDSPGRWDDAYFREIGLADLVEERYKRIGQIIKPAGSPAGRGLTREAARQMGLKAHTPVGVSIIDAHAGGLGLLGMGMDESNGRELNFENRIALIGGTSSCHMAVSRKPRFIDGIWGPYYSAMLPDMWLNEGGQSATGALIDHIIFSSKQSIELEEKAGKEDRTVYDVLNKRLFQLAEERNVRHVGMLTENLHVLPYFHGNRSPRANPSLAGSICGLQLSCSIDDLALLYLSAIQAIAYGTRHIIETMNDNGYKIDQIMATGGGTKNEIFLQEHANICDCQILLPKESEAVLLGSAVLGAVASGRYSDIYEAMRHMNKAGRVIEPNGGEIKRYHNAKYEVFHKMYRDELSYFEIMRGK